MVKAGRNQVYLEVALASMEPLGWLRAWLQTQASGLTGHLEVAGFPFDTKGWTVDRIATRSGYGQRWWPYEQYAYWVDGMMRCGCLLRDTTLIRKARKHTDHVLRQRDAQGYLGPACLKHTSKDERLERWPHAVFFRALMAQYSATGDKGVVRKLVRHYLSGTAEHFVHRNVCNLEIMAWLYHQTGERKLRKAAVRAFEKYNRLHAKADTSVKKMLSADVPQEHGVSYLEITKLAALVYSLTGERRLLRASVNAFRKLDRHHMLVSGAPSSTERLRGINSLASHETCDIADYIWSAGYLLMLTGDAGYGDRIERACFNAAPGASTSDFKAVQYFSCPNQVVAHGRSNHNLHGMGCEHMSYRPNPATECCPANATRITPNYAARMWMTDGTGGVVAALFGPSRVSLRAGANLSPVTITEETAYPFDEEIRFHIKTAMPVRFSFRVRIPGWCRNAALHVNGRRVRRALKPGRFATLVRTFGDGDVILLQLPMQVRLSRWPEGGVAVERGPLVFALPVRTRRSRDRKDGRSSGDFPAWNLRPASAWNYALATSGRQLAGGFYVRLRTPRNRPWDEKNAPVEIHCTGQRVPGWSLRRLKRLRDGHARRRAPAGQRFEFMPPLPVREKIVRVRDRITPLRLVPYGCTRLRISIFPERRV